MSARVTPAAFRGAWRITTMELWAPDAVDLLGPATVVFDDEAFGEFRFIAVRGWMDCRFSERSGRPLVEFSWLGKDEMDDASGRGWAIIEDDDTLAGRIYFHQGDDSAFTAGRGVSTERAALRSKARARRR